MTSMSVGALLHQAFEVLDRLVALAELLEAEPDLDVGALPDRRVVGDAVEDLDRPVDPLQALEDVGERDEREGVIRVEIERKAQIDDGRELVALLVAGRAEPVEDLGGALLRARHERHERLAGLQLQQGVADDRMTGQQPFERGIRGERRILAPAARFEARIGVDDPQGRSSPRRRRPSAAARPRPCCRPRPRSDRRDSRGRRCRCARP